MEYNRKKTNDPVFDPHATGSSFNDPLFGAANGNLYLNREKSSSYFSNDSATCLDEKISAVIHQKTWLERFGN